MYIISCSWFTLLDHLGSVATFGPWPVCHPSWTLFVKYLEIAFLLGIDLLWPRHTMVWYWYVSLFMCLAWCLVGFLGHLLLLPACSLVLCSLSLSRFGSGGCLSQGSKWIPYVLGLVCSQALPSFRTLFQGKLCGKEVHYAANYVIFLKLI